MKLKEQIDFVVAQVLLEIRSNFKWEKFKSLPTQKEKLAYLRSTKTEELGAGSSRIAFLLSNRFVLKLANPNSSNSMEKGLAQNKEEVEVALDNKAAPAVAPIYDYATDFSWVVSEAVRELSSGKEFEELTGVKFLPMFDFLNKIFRKNAETEEDIKERIKKQHKMIADIDEVLETLSADDPSRRYYLSDKEFEQRNLNYALNDLEKYNQMTSSPLVKALVYMITHKDAMVADMLAISHWGKTASGKVVLLDYGYSRDVARDLYGVWI